MNGSKQDDYIVRRGTEDDIEWTKRNFQSFICINMPPHWVLIYNGERIGIVGFVEQKKDVLIIDFVEILPPRGQNRGSNFLRRIEKEARKMGCRYLRTGRVIKRAERFWRNNGFDTFRYEENGVPLLQKELF